MLLLLLLCVFTATGDVTASYCVFNAAFTVTVCLLLLLVAAAVRVYCYGTDSNYTTSLLLSTF